MSGRSKASCRQGECDWSGAVLVNGEKCLRSDHVDRGKEVEKPLYGFKLS